MWRRWWRWCPRSAGCRDMNTAPLVSTVSLWGARGWAVSALGHLREIKLEITGKDQICLPQVGEGRKPNQNLIVSNRTNQPFNQKQVCRGGRAGWGVTVLWALCPLALLQSGSCKSLMREGQAAPLPGPTACPSSAARPRGPLPLSVSAWQPASAEGLSHWLASCRVLRQLWSLGCQKNLCGLTRVDLGLSTWINFMTSESFVCDKIELQEPLSLNKAAFYLISVNTLLKAGKLSCWSPRRYCPDRQLTGVVEPLGVPDTTQGCCWCLRRQWGDPFGHWEGNNHWYVLA